MKTNEKRVMSLGRIFTLKNVVFCTIGMICFALVSYRSESQKLGEVAQASGFEVYLASHSLVTWKLVLRVEILLEI